MGRLRKTFRIAGAIASLAIVVWCQQPRAKNVAWIPVEGKDREFIVYLPEGFVRHANAGIRLLWNEHQPRVKSMGVIARMINGTALVMKYYSGDSDALQRMMVEMYSLQLSSEREIGGFKIKEFNSTYGKTHRRVQHYIKGQRMYVVESFALKDDYKIANGFFDSVRVINDGIAVAPNVPRDSTKTWLPRIAEIDNSAMDTKIYSPEEVDRDIIVLYSPAPREERHFMKGRIPQDSMIDVVYGANGKVESVSGVDGYLTHRENAMDAVKNVIFIPAQKDGRAVSVRRTIRYRTLR